MKWKVAFLLILGAACIRLLPHPFNFTPIGALGLFGAAHFGRKWLALLIPFAVLFLSDLAVNNIQYRELNTSGDFIWFTSGYIYAAFALVVAIGLIAFRNQISWLRILGAGFAASVVFFLVTNFSVWAEGTMYPKTVGGLIACLTAGIPFFGNTLAGDLFYSVLLFGTYAWLTKEKIELKLAPIRVKS